MKVDTDLERYIIAGVIVLSGFLGMMMDNIILPIMICGYFWAITLHEDD